MAIHWMKLLTFLLIVNVHDVHGDDVGITIVDNATALSKGAVCLDGTPPAFNYAPGVGEEAHNWLVYLEGGAWCVTEGSCVNRSLNGFGSSNLMGKYWTFVVILSNSQQINPYFYNWNRVLVRYCDGASFSSNVEKVDPKTNLHLRGARIYKLIMEELLQKGMGNATNQNTSPLDGDGPGLCLIERKVN